MLYYLLTDNEDNAYKLVKVHLEDQAAFVKRHADDIVYEGQSIAEILAKFSERVQVFSVSDDG